jgi:hypothetical protein
MRFFVSDANGFIVRGGDCPESQIAHQQVGPGETLHLGDATTWTHKVADGVPVPYSAAELAAIAARPSRRHVWNVATGQWDDLRTPGEKDAERRATLLAQIRALELTQLRSTRELVLARGSQLEARARLEQIDDQIAALRAQLP